MTHPQPAGRPRYEQRKAAIVRAAVEVINAKGVHGMSLGDVAQAVGVVPHAVNYYFRGKEELAAACFLHAIEIYDALVSQAEQAETPEARLRALLLAFADVRAAVDTGRAEPIAAFNDVRAIGHPAVDAAYTAFFRRVRRLLSPDAARPQDAGRPHRNARTHLLISQVFWAVLWFGDYDPQDYRRMADRLCDVLVGGLAAPHAAWAPADLALPAAPTDGGEVQEAFLRAATHLLNEHGYTRASVSRMAERLNLTKGAAYHQIEAKDVLVERCFDRTLQIMRTAQLAADAATRNGLDNLVSLTASMVGREVSGEAPLLRTSALTTAPREMQAALVRRFHQFSGRVASVLCDGVADGSVRPVDVNVAAQAITAMVNASAELLHWAPGLTAERAAEVYARPLFTGLVRPVQG